MIAAMNFLRFLGFVFGVAFGAFCIWLTVQFVNRRKKRTTWTIASAIVGAAALYVLSVGPAARLAQEGLLDYSVLRVVYAPFGLVENVFPDWVGAALVYYLYFWGVGGGD